MPELPVPGATGAEQPAATRPPEDAVDRAAHRTDVGAGDEREVLDVVEWVSEVRRLYVEPKTGTARRGDRGRTSRSRPEPSSLRATATTAGDAAAVVVPLSRADMRRARRRRPSARRMLVGGALLFLVVVAAVGFTLL